MTTTLLPEIRIGIVHKIEQGFHGYAGKKADEEEKKYRDFISQEWAKLRPTMTGDDLFITIGKTEKFCSLRFKHNNKVICSHYSNDALSTIRKSSKELLRKLNGKKPDYNSEILFRALRVMFTGITKVKKSRVKYSVEE